jgi:hypothetical protein
MLPACLPLLVAGALQALDARPDTVRIPRAAIADAMREEQGYERRVPTNQTRLQTRVLLRLGRAIRAARPEGAVLFIDYEDWFRAYLEALGLREDEAPLSVRLTHEHQYDVVVDGRADVVVERVPVGASLAQALNVLWRSRRGTGYGYRDSLSNPEFEVKFAPAVSYRLLEFEGMVVQDEFAGVSGRPATGALSVLFRLLGQARPVWSRSAVADDGWQVVRGKGRKGPFSRTATVTVEPAGAADAGVPPDRPDLADLERRLKQPIEVVYCPWRRD